MLVPDTGITTFLTQGVPREDAPGKAGGTQSQTFSRITLSHFSCPVCVLEYCTISTGVFLTIFTLTIR